MNEKNTGGSAFPLPAHKVKYGPGTQPLHVNAEYGMTLRDYFAAKALVGIISNANCTPGVTYEEVAVRAYQQADAMLKEREK